MLTVQQCRISGKVPSRLDFVHFLDSMIDTHCVRDEVILPKRWLIRLMLGSSYVRIAHGVRQPYSSVQ